MAETALLFFRALAVAFEKINVDGLLDFSHYAQWSRYGSVLMNHIVR